MKLSPSSFLSFLLLLVWSSLSIAAVLPDATDNAIDTASYAKRGAVVSKLKPLAKVYETVPTVAELVSTVKYYGFVKQRDSIFYSGMGGGGAQVTALAWHKANAQQANGRAGVTFDSVVAEKWLKKQGDKLSQQAGGIGKVDLFQKRLSQAFAEVANGKVYFFTTAGNDGTKMYAKTTWAAYEFPALTRNPAVTEVIQVSMSGKRGTAKIIWRKGDRPTAKAPLGNAPLSPPPGQHGPSP